LPQKLPRTADRAPDCSRCDTTPRHDTLAGLAAHCVCPQVAQLLPRDGPLVSSSTRSAVQVSTMFVPLAREGWLQKLVASPGRPFGAWRVLWVELLEDGKLSWFDSARKRKSDFRHISCRCSALVQLTIQVHVRLRGSVAALLCHSSPLSCPGSTPPASASPTSGKRHTTLP
jgi:hypothetical protein